MPTYVYRDGKLVEKHLAQPIGGSVSRAPGVISDTMTETRHMADGKMYTSKHKFREATKAAGCIELGNDPSLYRPRKPVQLDRAARREAIKQTIHQLSGGRYGRP